MSKLPSVLLAALFATGAALAQTSAAGSYSYGSKPAANDTSSSPATATKPATPAPSTKPYAAAPATKPYASQQQMAVNDKDKEKDKVKNDKKDKSAYDTKAPAHQQMAANDKDKADKPCPPGLEKKANGCVPPGHAKAHDTRAMGAGPAKLDRDRDHDRDRDDRHHRQHQRRGHHQD